MPRDFEKPVRKPGDARTSDGWRETHPSYALIGVAHVSGLNGPMFGSTLARHDGYISIRIRRAEREHAHGEDRFPATAEPPLIEVILTHAQFVELISRPNRGDGVPCSLRHLNGESFPEVPYDEEDQTELSETLRTAEAQGKKLAKVVERAMSETEKILRDAKVSEKTIAKVVGNVGPLAMLRQELGSNIPFFLTQVKEAADRVVSNARTEVDSFVTIPPTSSGSSGSGRSRRNRGTT